MLRIVIKGEESWDEDKEEFVHSETRTVDLEHSLVSLSKWEEIWEVPFLDVVERSQEEIVSYIQMMILDPNVDPEIVYKFSEQNFDDVRNYIEAKRSATWFNEFNGPGGKKASEKFTSELIYFWLVHFNIPFEVETWHLNKLFNLIKICNLKLNPPKKMSKAEAAAQQRSLNRQRLAQQQKSKG